MSQDKNHKENILIAIKDRKLATDFIEKWREHYPQCQIQFNFVEDGLKAVQEAKLLSPSLAIIDEEISSKSGSELANSLLESYGQIQVIILSHEDLSANSFPSLHLPITDWTLATQLIASLLPSSFLQLYNIQLGDPILRAQLLKYSEKYQQHLGSLENSESHLIFVNYSPRQNDTSTPQHIELRSQSKSFSTTHHEMMSASTTEQNELPSLNDFQVLLGEISVIGILAMAIGWLGLPKEGDLYLTLSVKIILIFLLAFSCLGFFTLRLLKTKRET